MRYLTPSRLVTILGLSSVFAIASTQAIETKEYYGTKNPFAKESIYFAVTDRFVDGDPTNNHEDQGGTYPTFDQKLIAEDGKEANVGYLGGDLQGVLRNAQYLKEMGFTAVWLTPIMDNPDENFSGGEPIEFGGKFKDGGKTGYHGYWINNFFLEDEHYVSANLDFETYAKSMKDLGFKIVFDIVTNHGSPAFTMPIDQPKFGELYDKNGNLIADHQNLMPSELDSNNPLHTFFRHERDIAELSDFDYENPAVLDYFVDAYLSWIKKGADVFRIDTIKHVPHHFWAQFTAAIREKHPDFFMFGESFSYDSNFLAQHTLPKNGGVSVLDFVGRATMLEVFGTEQEPEDGTTIDRSYSRMNDYLHLTHGPYQNPYDLITFYDNHDMSRLPGNKTDFIDAHNWLFTSRGIPCVYYGSEIAFMAGTEEHAGNRNYFGQDNVEIAKSHPIHHALTTIANVRKQTPALQNGLQLNISLEEDTAVFYRILQIENIHQTALVLLNKSDQDAELYVNQFLQNGNWTNVMSGEQMTIRNGEKFETTIQPHQVQVWVLNALISDPELIEELDLLMDYK